MPSIFTCAACGEKFSTVANFNKHRKGKYVDLSPTYGRFCVNPSTVGLVKSKFDTWKSPSNSAWISKVISKQRNRSMLEKSHVIQ
mgnify:CR=1 FL=1